MCFSSPKAPPIPPAIPQPTEQDQAVVDAMDRERRKRSAQAGMASTLLTGGQGLTTPAPTQQKTLLGQ